ncbi:type II toxin-antitoxin system VapC family toxin [Sphingomonas bacterium]|uniref:type II toxin-antitoxin system VapC family toxin n=1 Tax=Sphingomonas bacterium TaxID=1895847 RepID=UPI0015750AF6|nr:type II toxin-antitoxin system VapC family toxin [Sphingomonas bacterium]
MVEPRYLLDTNALIHLLCGAHPPLRQRVQQQDVGAVVTSTLCVAEALVGARAKGKEAGLADLVRRIEPVPFDLAAAFANVQVPFKRARLDRLIAAHALSLGLIVVTHNEADFADVPGLTVENWTR